MNVKTIQNVSKKFTDFLNFVYLGVINLVVFKLLVI